MTRRKAKKTPKPPSKKKITGTVIELTPKQIKVLSKGQLWKIARKPKPKVISGTLRRHFSITIEFNRRDAVVLRDSAGKRTEQGTVIGSSVSQITLQIPAKGTWIITRTASTKVTPPNPPPGSTATVESNEEDWHPA